MLGVVVTGPGHPPVGSRPILRHPENTGGPRPVGPDHAHVSFDHGDGFLHGGFHPNLWRAPWV